MAGSNEDVRGNPRSICEEEGDSSESNESESELQDDEIYPALEPVYDGNDIDIDARLAENGLSAISLRRLPQGLKLSQGAILERNTFYNIHRPELTKLHWAKKISEECRKEAIEKMFLEVTNEDVKVNDQSSELCRQLSSIMEYNSSHSSPGSSRTASNESIKKASNSFTNSENSHLLLLMAPVQMQNHSDDSVIWSMNDMREACPPESQGKRIGRETGGGEEDIQFEGGEMLSSYYRSGNNLSYLLHNSPAITNLLTMDGANSSPSARNGI